MQHFTGKVLNILSVPLNTKIDLWLTSAETTHLKHLLKNPVYVISKTQAEGYICRLRRNIMQPLEAEVEAGLLSQPGAF